MGIKRSVLIRQSDLSCRKALDKNKIWSKIQKTKNKIFPLYFWPKCFVNLILKCWYLKWLRFKRNFLCSLYTHRHKLSISNFREYLKFLFFDTPYCLQDLCASYYLLLQAQLWCRVSLCQPLCPLIVYMVATILPTIFHEHHHHHFDLRYHLYLCR